MPRNLHPWKHKKNYSIKIFEFPRIQNFLAFLLFITSKEIAACCSFIFFDFSRVGHLYALSHHSDIWKPDIILIKHGTYKVLFTLILHLLIFFCSCKTIHPTEVSLKVFQNGTISYTMRRHLVLNCEGDLPIFPFDSPMCSFNIESGKNFHIYAES